MPLSYTDELVHLDMNPILQKEQIVTACKEEDKQVQDVVNSVPLPKLPYTSFDGFAKVYSPDEEGEHNQRYWERSQNRDYFFQLHNHKLDNPESNAGGWLGLV